MPDRDLFYDDPLAVKKMTLEKVLDQTGSKTIQDIDDLCDDWDHSIRIKPVKETLQSVTCPGRLKATGPSRPRTSAALGTATRSWKPP